MNIKFLFPTNRALINFWLITFLIISLFLLKDALKPELVILLNFIVIYLFNEWLKDIEEYKKEEVNKNE
jgi:hypothetical protein